MIYDLYGNVVSIGRNELDVELEGGSIGSTGTDSTSIADFGAYSRSALYIKLNGAEKVDVDLSEVAASSVSAFFYSARDLHLVSVSATKNEGGVATITVPSGAALLRLMIAGKCDRLRVRLDTEGALVRRGTANAKINFTYQVYDDVCNVGWLMLPPNYDPDGDPVPLIVFGHGSQRYNKWTDGMPMAGNRRYLADEGFAVIDLFGWTSKYAVKYNNDFRGNDPLSIPLHIQAHGQAIHYVTTRYNVDAGNIHVMSMSMGGLLALYVTVHNPWNVKSVGMFAPVLDYISIRGTTQENPSRTLDGIADELGFTGSVDEIRSRFYYDPVAVAYIQANKEAYIQNNPAWMNIVGQTLDERLAASIENCEKYWSGVRTGIYQDYHLAQIGKVPTKIWGAPDDQKIPYAKMVETVAQLINGGCEAHMRTMPSGCGGHYSVENTQYAAITKSNVTTACGVHYDAVPLAYWENIQWIRLQMGKSYDIDGINPPSA